MKRSIANLEASVGEQVRRLRLAQNLTQAEVADGADISTATLASLEAGHGSRLATLAGVLRVLDREAWLDELAPPAAPNPMAALRAQREGRPPPELRKRASRR